MTGSARSALAVALAVVGCAGLIAWQAALGAAGLDPDPGKQGDPGSGDRLVSSPCDPATTDRLIRIGTTDNLAMEHLDHLCNRIGPRPAGTASDRQACEWAADRLREFGLSDVHLEECGEIPGGFFETGRARSVKRFLRRATFQDPDGRPSKLYNVVADIPGTKWPDEYVIVGAHLDSTPRGTGATDNATGAAAVMEAARLLMEAGARPARTIRFILFAGEEVGLVGSRGYVRAHPELVSRISAMYNMDHGSDFISRISATAPLLADMEAVFAPAKEINPAMPFAVELVDYIPKADPNCCMGVVAPQGSDGPIWAMRKVLKRNPDGSLEAADLKALGITEEDIKRGVDSKGRKLMMFGGCGGSAGDGAGSEVCGQPTSIPAEDLAAMGFGTADSTGRVMMRAHPVGSSDQASFLNVGIPSFWWSHGDSSSAVYPAHRDTDTFDKVVPRNIEHSAIVIALGALGTADLDHMLSRERLTDPDEGAGGMPVSMPASGQP